MNSNSETPKKIRLVTLQQILSDGRIPVSASTIYRWYRAGKFPKPAKLAGTRRVWDWTEIEEWIEREFNRRDGYHYGALR